MAYANLADLRDKVADYLERTGDAEFLSLFPIFVLSVEDQINKALFTLSEDGVTPTDRIPALSDDADSNWILTGIGSIYFFGVVMEAAIADLASEAQGQLAGTKFSDHLNDLSGKRKAVRLTAAKPGGQTP
ncbi:hypothetical protein [Cohaesibacter marisflavi]|uniref:hypothetical protein n=1 Tax=Cohaesibacter marisflavi TaxID=655353 RepID=UPI0029C9043D|nr:hypothetical protein [Cohaesibacter marisflavi]